MSSPAYRAILLFTDIADCHCGHWLTKVLSSFWIRLVNLWHNGWTCWGIDMTKKAPVKKTRKTQVRVSNVNVPGKKTNLDSEKYEAMKRAILKVTPKRSPGLTAAEMVTKVKPHLPEGLWPNNEKVGWWQKTVQLDLESRGVLIREKESKPLRWHRA